MTIRALRRNVATLGLSGAEIVRSTVQRVVQNTSGNPHDVRFLDPAYAMRDDGLAEVLSKLESGGWLAADGICVVERSPRFGSVPWADGMGVPRDRRYEEGVLWYGIRS